MSQNDEKPTVNLGRPEDVSGSADSKVAGKEDADKSFRNFDLNIDLNENGDSTSILNGAPSDSATKLSPEMKHEDIPGWSLDDVQRMASDPTQFAILNGTIDEEDEDYDEE